MKGAFIQLGNHQHIIFSATIPTISEDAFQELWKHCGNILYKVFTEQKEANFDRYELTIHPITHRL